MVLADSDGSVEGGIGLGGGITRPPRTEPPPLGCLSATSARRARPLASGFRPFRSGRGSAGLRAERGVPLPHVHGAPRGSTGLRGVQAAPRGCGRSAGFRPQHRRDQLARPSRGCRGGPGRRAAGVDPGRGLGYSRARLARRDVGAAADSTQSSPTPPQLGIRRLACLPQLSAAAPGRRGAPASIDACAPGRASAALDDSLAVRDSELPTVTSLRTWPRLGTSSAGRPAGDDKPFVSYVYGLYRPYRFYR
jgi:hypothetical protein